MGQGPHVLSRLDRMGSGLRDPGSRSAQAQGAKDIISVVQGGAARKDALERTTHGDCKATASPDPRQAVPSRGAVRCVVVNAQEVKLKISDEVKNVFEYRDGSLIRKSTGKRGYTRPDGYVYVRLNGKAYGEHRLIFLLFTGEWPQQVDHINGNPSDNRIENLRAATHAQNCMNRKPSGSAAKGCYWQPKRRKWIAQIGFNNIRKTIGYFDQLEDAKIAYASAAHEIHGQFARIA